MLKWTRVEDKKPLKDRPILVWNTRLRFPTSVMWDEEGIYGESCFVEENGEYVKGENEILYWMECPQRPMETEE